MGVNFSQIFPPAPTLTEKNLPSQNGKVFIVTGGYSGIGLETVRFLYQAGGKVYIAGRSKEKAQKAIDEIKTSSPPDASPGQLEFLRLELDDLSTIKDSVQSFTDKESRLDVLWNNAGISLAPIGSVSKQGHELHMATNCLGPFLFTQLLLPILRKTAAASPEASVRVVWAASQMIDLSAPPEGIIMSQLDNPPPNTAACYTMSKVGNWFMASELARRAGSSGVVSVAQNPGSLNSNLLRNGPWMQFFFRPLLHPTKFGAYTELWAGLSDGISGGDYVIPWGRLHTAPRPELVSALKSVMDGGTGRAREFWEWCEKRTERFM